MSEFKTIETQAELDAIIKNRLQRENEKFSDYEQLKSRISELEKENAGYKSALEESKNSQSVFEQQINDLQSRVLGYETSSLKTRIALQSGLPYELAERLQGADETEIMEDAERLYSLLNVSKPVAPLKTTETEVGEQDVYKTLVQKMNFN